jgi:thiamine pyrophosphate-dependent acetolactate synthase large subunit-like protein
MDRLTLLRTIWESTTKHDCLISALGFLSRDLWSVSHIDRARCLYCLGSMGSVLPLGLGLALTKKAGRVVCLEGDGSLLMNLGALISAARYGPSGLLVVISDNGVYESTGGQATRAAAVDLSAIIRGTGLPAEEAINTEDVRRFFEHVSMCGPRVLVAKTSVQEPGPRITESVITIRNRFVQRINTSQQELEQP